MQNYKGKKSNEFTKPILIKLIIEIIIRKFLKRK